MTINLDRHDLERLVKGSQLVNLDQMSNPLVKKAGYYIGGMNDVWNWNDRFDNMSDDELFELYTYVKSCEISNAKFLKEKYGI